MSNPKRVWDSKKRAVRQDKQQVWLVDGEKKVNTNHGFADATGTDVVYDSSWKQAQEPLQIYDNRWEDVDTPEIIPNNIATTYKEDTVVIDLLVDGDSKIEIIPGEELSVVPSGKYIDKGIDTVLASIDPDTLFGSLVTYELGENSIEGILYSTIEFAATGVFDSEFMRLVQALYDSYSVENAAALKTYIESKSVTIEEGATEMVSWNLVKITAAVNDSSYGTTNPLWFNIAPGIEPVVNGTEVEFPYSGESSITLFAEPNEGYSFVRWDNVPQVVTGATTITAIFESASPTPPFVPGVNTLFYYPFTDNQLDQLNNTSIDVVGTQETLGYTFDLPTEQFTTLTNGQATCAFVSFWIKANDIGDGTTSSMGPSTYLGPIDIIFNHGNTDYARKFQAQTGQSDWQFSNDLGITTNTWYHVAFGYDSASSKIKAYLNGVKAWELSSSIYSGQGVHLGIGIEETLSDFIGESVIWTDQQVLDYYNATESQYSGR